MPLNLPILLTWLRIVAIPLFIAVYYLPDAADACRAHLTATLIFMAAGFTDWADGYLGHVNSTRLPPSVLSSIRWPTN